MRKYAISVTTENSFLSAQKDVDELDEAIDYAKELVKQCLLGGSFKRLCNQYFDYKTV